MESKQLSIVRVANAQGFWGDQPGAAARLATLEPRLDFITLDYLAEVSLSIMAIQRERDPKTGFARDFVDVVRSLAPMWKQGSKVKVVTNAGGLNPRGCIEACAAVLRESGCTDKKLALVSGDDVLSELQAGSSDYANLESGSKISTVSDRLVTANAYVGAEPIVRALAAGADIVVTGRVADPSLVVGPCIHHFGWSHDDWDAIAGATIAGHLIECGTQVTGGISTNWLELADCVDIGFPIVEIASNGSCVVTKPAGTGGAVTERSVKEQLLYELGDPANYKSPDATVSFLNLEVLEIAADRVAVRGGQGTSPPSTYKVSATYREGFACHAMLIVFGKDAVKKARRAGQVIVERVRQAGFSLEKCHFECLGTGDSVPGVVRPEYTGAMIECVLRIAVYDRDRAGPERFAREIAPMVTSGPQGVTGYATGRPDVRPVFGYWPCLIDRDLVETNWEIIQA